MFVARARDFAVTNHRIAYSPLGVKQMAAYRERVFGLADEGKITKAEASMLCTIEMTKIMQTGQVGARYRRPVCGCGLTSTVIGDAQTFRCPCSPNTEQSVADCVGKA